jgi:catechol 2,3-dioxygenase-like lactoylglutathione lyase family enzyme
MRKGLVHHIELYVSNLERSKEFWGWFLTELGYESFQKWDKGCSWMLGDTYIVFVQVEERFSDIPYHRCRVGLNHLAFHLDTHEEVIEMTEKLKRKNVPILYEEKHPFAGGPNHFTVFFEDPDRIKVELVAPV